MHILRKVNNSFTELFIVYDSECYELNVDLSSLQKEEDGNTCRHMRFPVVGSIYDNTYNDISGLVVST